MAQPNTVPAFQRATVLAELPVLLRELGIDPTAVFDGTGIDPDVITPDTRLPLVRIGELLEKSSRLARLPHLGLLLGMRFKLRHHGIIGRFMQYAPTLRHALADFIALQPGYSSGAIVYVSRWDNDYAFGYAFHHRFETGRRQFYDCVMAIGWRMLEELTCGRARPIEFHLCGRQPAEPAVYSRFIKTTLRFDQHNTCAILDAAAMDTPLPLSDGEQRSRVLAELELMMKGLEVPLSVQVRRTLRGLLMAGDPSMTVVASRLKMHPRQLRRHLAIEGLTFKALRDEVRFAVARELLELTTLSMGDVSSALAFSTQGTFSDAFCRWAGKSPSLWREQFAVET
jgi:AraC-like DNA-binding protein